MSAVRRRARRLLRRVSHSRRPGTGPVPVAELISPLRYDILVRERFLDRLAHVDQPGDAVAGSEGLAYRAWFEGLVVPRFMPKLLGDPDAISAAFADRVQRSADLLRSFADSGYDRGRPIVLQAGRRLQPTATGKRLARPVFAGDGCHRLALLRTSGTSDLAPDDYVVERSATLKPIDNTATLIPLLRIGIKEYLAFLSLCYAPGANPASEAELRAWVAERVPERAAELDGVLRVDLPLLDAREP